MILSRSRDYFPFRGFGVVQLGDLTLDHVSRIIIGPAGTQVKVGTRATEILFTLAETPNKFVSRRKLMATVWPGLNVEDQNLSVQVSMIRKVLAQHSRSVIQASSGRGYRLVILDEGHAATPTAPSIPEDVAAATVRVVGRDTDIERALAALDRERLVTICGPAGIGKTTLAREVARRCHGLYQSQVVWVDLAAATREAEFQATLAAAFRLQWSGAQAVPLVDRLAIEIKDAHMLLVLDNCEHLRTDVATLIRKLQSRCHNVRALVTSQARLELPEEVALALEGLPVPAAAASTRDILLAPAVTLFLDRLAARAADQGFDAEGVERVAAICRDLEGIPLALELAAGVAAESGLASLGADLRARLALPGTPLPGTARYRTLGDALALSLGMLAPSELTLFRRLSVFQDGFGRDDALAVAGLDMMEQALDAALASLLAKSLLHRQEPVGGRLFMLAVQREAAAKLLVESGEEAVIRDRHARYFARDVEIVWVKRRAASTRELERLLGARVRDCRAAIRWAMDNGPSDVFLALVANTGVEFALDIHDPLWASDVLRPKLLSHLEGRAPDDLSPEAVMVLMRLLPFRGVTFATHEFLHALFDMLKAAGRYDVAIPLMYNSIVMRSVEDRFNAEVDAAIATLEAAIAESGLSYETPHLHWLLAHRAMSREDETAAVDHARKAARLFDTAGREEERAAVRTLEVYCLRLLGRSAEAALLASKEVERPGVSTAIRAYMAGNLGAVLVVLGDHDEAMMFLRRAYADLSLLSGALHHHAVAWILDHAAECRAVSDRPETAALLHGAGAKGGREALPSEEKVRSRTWVRLVAMLGEEQALTLSQEGETLSREAILDLM